MGNLNTKVTEIENNKTNNNIKLNDVVQYFAQKTKLNDFVNEVKSNKEKLNNYRSLYIFIFIYLLFLLLKNNLHSSRGKLT